ncbi:MAG TPA: mechanosensitive ion channel family protein [Candidatus Nitrosotalea sp.]|nr:mechanosensitive ion channel family protein [Candidatus Nitrosotalea sp.]
MSASTDKSPSDISKLGQETIHRKSLHRELYELAIKAILSVAITWVSLHLFERFVAPLVGITHTHIQIAGILATVIISFLIITATRGLLKKFTSKTHPQFSASLSFFVIIVISLIASLSILHQLNVNPQDLLISGGVAAIIVGIGVSTIVGNILSSGLILTTYPAKIGDSIHVVNDNVRGKIQEINLMYTTIETDDGKEYIVPNNAIIQGNVRIAKDISIADQLPYSEGDMIEIKGALEKYIGTVIKITPKFTTILNEERTKEYILASSMILEGNFTIIKHRTKS